MWRDKKPRPEPLPSMSPAAPPPPLEVPPYPAPVPTLGMETPMNETIMKAPSGAATPSRQTQLGKSVVLRGELSAKEDLLVDGQFEGTISVEDNCVTVGAEGQVKAEIRARQIVILGTVTGKVVAREKVEIRRSGRLVGDLTAGSVAIEEGAYFKGSIDILREGAEEGARVTSPDGRLSSLS